LNHLDKLKDAFDLLYEEHGSIAAYEDLIGRGSRIKRRLDRV
jgi:hypothetical protein